MSARVLAEWTFKTPAPLVWTAHFAGPWVDATACCSALLDAGVLAVVVERGGQLVVACCARPEGTLPCLVGLSVVSSPPVPWTVPLLAQALELAVRHGLQLRGWARLEPSQPQRFTFVGDIVWNDELGGATLASCILTLACEPDEAHPEAQATLRVALTAAMPRRFRLRRVRVRAGATLLEVPGSGERLGVEQLVAAAGAEDSAKDRALARLGARFPMEPYPASAHLAVLSLAARCGVRAAGAQVLLVRVAGQDGARLVLPCCLAAQWEPLPGIADDVLVLEWFARSVALAVQPLADLSRPNSSLQGLARNGDHDNRAASATTREGLDGSRGWAWQTAAAAATLRAPLVGGLADLTRLAAEEDAYRARFLAQHPATALAADAPLPARAGPQPLADGPARVPVFRSPAAPAGLAAARAPAKPTKAAAPAAAKSAVPAKPTAPASKPATLGKSGKVAMSLPKLAAPANPSASAAAVKRPAAHQPAGSVGKRPAQVGTITGASGVGAGAAAGPAVLPDTGAMTVPQLKDWLREHKAKVGGTRAELVARVLALAPAAP